MTPDHADPPAVGDEDTEAIAAICDTSVSLFCDDLASEIAARELDWRGVELHVLASLTRHIHQRLPQAVRQARTTHFMTWDEIGDIWGVSASAARQRYARHTCPPTEGAATDH